MNDENIRISVGPAACSAHKATVCVCVCAEPLTVESICALQGIQRIRPPTRNSSPLWNLNTGRAAIGRSVMSSQRRCQDDGEELSDIPHREQNEQAQSTPAAVVPLPLPRPTFDINLCMSATKSLSSRKRRSVTRRDANGKVLQALQSAEQNLKSKQDDHGRANSIRTGKNAFQSPTSFKQSHLLHVLDDDDDFVDAPGASHAARKRHRGPQPPATTVASSQGNELPVQDINCCPTYNMSPERYHQSRDTFHQNSHPTVSRPIVVNKRVSSASPRSRREAILRSTINADNLDGMEPFGKRASSDAGELCADSASRRLGDRQAHQESFHNLLKDDFSTDDDDFLTTPMYQWRKPLSNCKQTNKKAVVAKPLSLGAGLCNATPSEKNRNSPFLTRRYKSNSPQLLCNERAGTGQAENAAEDRRKSRLAQKNGETSKISPLCPSLGSCHGNAQGEDPVTPTDGSKLCRLSHSLCKGSAPQPIELEVSGDAESVAKTNSRVDVYEADNGVIVVRRTPKRSPQDSQQSEPTAIAPDSEWLQERHIDDYSDSNDSSRTAARECTHRPDTASCDHDSKYNPKAVRRSLLTDFSMGEHLEPGSSSGTTHEDDVLTGCNDEAKLKQDYCSTVDKLTSSAAQKSLDDVVLVDFESEHDDMLKQCSDRSTDPPPYNIRAILCNPDESIEQMIERVGEAAVVEEVVKAYSADREVIGAEALGLDHDWIRSRALSQNSALSGKFRDSTGRVKKSYDIEAAVASLSGAKEKYAKRYENSRKWGSRKHFGRSFRGGRGRRRRGRGKKPP